jgi:hypothetical protein
MDFKLFKTAVQKQFANMCKYPLFRVMVDKDALWNLYLDAFPEGTNLVYKERREYDCNCCKQFVRAVGNVVAVIDGKLVSIWDVETGDLRFDIVADTVAELIKSHPIDNVFLHTERTAGTDKNFQEIVGGQPVAWEHFFVAIPQQFVMRGDAIGPRLSESRSTFDVMRRGLLEITTDAVDTVLELISQNSLYRGEEHKFALTEFQKLQKEFSKACASINGGDIFCWAKAGSPAPAAARIRNTAIGTLLVNLSAGMEMEEAVKKFEALVAPANYKRPTALVTKSMIDNAKNKIEELGFTSALERRFAVLSDITINNILFADRSAKPKMGGDVFADMATKVPQAMKSLDKVEEVSIEKFLADILPKATALEIMFDNKHTGNLVSLIAPVDATAKGMFKWPNNFSWSYNGEMADSMKERVKAAGGKVDGDLRFSILWNEKQNDRDIDLDAHCNEPNGNRIYFGNRGRRHNSSGMLDVDIRTPGMQVAVENITYSDRNKMPKGLYQLKVNNYSSSRCNEGFSAEVECDGTLHSFSYNRPMKGNETVIVAEVVCDGKGGFKVNPKLDSSVASKDVWGLSTQQFHKVNVVLQSPNHWDSAVGNKHYFFMLDGAVNDGTARGFFNEFLSSELDAHRKVMEIVGSKMKVAESANQLSGLGFSSTQRNSVLCRVTGSFNRVVKINF